MRQADQLEDPDLPGPGEDEARAQTSPARLAAAAALRQLGNALVAHHVDDPLLGEITAQVDRLVARVQQAPERPHAFEEIGPALFTRPMPDGAGAGPRSAFPDCIVSGKANPMGIAAQLWREGDQAVLQTTLGAAFEGAPGRAHGGIVAALIDETMGLVLSITATPAFTGRLTVAYRGPTPLGVPLEARARMTGRAGRKMTITAELRSPEKLLAEAEALFIAVDPEHFFDPGPDR
jgi:acyl-coenzyme A thioesterase PaaI-like protein